MLFPTPTLTTADTRVLAEVDRIRAELRHELQGKPGKWAGGLRKFLTADTIAASNSIEGFSVSTVDVEDLIAGERDVEVSEENKVETLAYERMLTYIRTLHAVVDFAYSTGFLNALRGGGLPELAGRVLAAILTRSKAVTSESITQDGSWSA